MATVGRSMGDARRESATRNHRDTTTWRASVAAAVATVANTSTPPTRQMPTWCSSRKRRTSSQEITIQTNTRMKDVFSCELFVISRFSDLTCVVVHISMNNSIPNA